MCSATGAAAASAAIGQATHMKETISLLLTVRVSKDSFMVISPDIDSGTFERCA